VHFGESIDEVGLHFTGVLVFIDEDVLELVLVAGTDLGEIAEQVQGEGEEIVIIHDVVGLLAGW